MRYPPRRFKIGRNPHDQSPVLFILRYFGVIILAARARFGKTSFLMNLIVKISKMLFGRKIIIFDFKGAWAKGITKFNWESKAPSRVKNYFVLKNFAFRISDFNQIEDWNSLGLTEKTASLIRDLAIEKELHHDDPKLFLKILDQLPTSLDEVDGFNSTYCVGCPNFALSSKVHESIQASAAGQFRSIKSWFLDEKNPNEKRNYVSKSDWYALLKRYDVIIIEFDMQNIEQLKKARAEAGKVLEMLASESKNTHQSYLQIFSPIIVLEEADKLCPNLPEGMVMPSSLVQCVNYATKYQREGVVMFFISQSTKQISKHITDHAHNYILGKLPFDDPMNKFLEARGIFDLYWNYDKNDRLLIYIDLDGRIRIFRPDLAVCNVED